MSSFRVPRLNEEIRREMSDLIQNEIKDPGLSGAMPSVLRVEVTRDLSHANVYISFYGEDRHIQSGIDAIERAGGFLRRELAKRLKVRRVPELHFIADDSIEYAAQMSKLIDQVMGEDE